MKKSIAEELADSMAATLNEKTASRKVKLAYDLLSEASVKLKNALAGAPAPESLSGTIERASGRPELGIPNFKAILSEHSSNSMRAVQSLILEIEVKSKNDVNVLSAQIVPVPGSNASNATYPHLLSELQKGIHNYFEKYWETINNVSPGVYTVTYPITAGQPVAQG